MRQGPGAYGLAAQPPRAGWLPRGRQRLEGVVYEPQLVGSTPHGVSAQDRGKCTGRQARKYPPGYRATAKETPSSSQSHRKEASAAATPTLVSRRAPRGDKEGDYGKDLQGGQAKAKYKRLGLPPGVLPPREFRKLL